jgi:hypothetical protein
MKRYLFRILSAVLCCGLGAATFVAWQNRSPINRSTQADRSTKPFEQGQHEAELDLSEGKLRLRVYGDALESKGADLSAADLLKEYGIELVRVADSVETDASVERTCGYNATALLTIERRYGKGILETLQQRTMAEWPRSRKMTIGH